MWVEGFGIGEEWARPSRGWGSTLTLTLSHNGDLCVGNYILVYYAMPLGCFFESGVKRAPDDASGEAHIAEKNLIVLGNCPA